MEKYQYHSKLTNENYDTVEELKAAEARVKAQFEEKVPTKDDKENVVAKERKADAKLVEDAFALASKQRKDNASKREELDEEIRKVHKKYDAKFEAIQKEYDRASDEASKAQDAEIESLEKQYRELDKADKENLEMAYAALHDFCKKHGAYHYSVDTAGAELFPMLLGFGQFERAQNMFKDLFSSMFNLW